MQRDTLSVLVVLTALLAVGLVGAALVAPSGADDSAGPADRNANADDSAGLADRNATADATGDAGSSPDRAVVGVATTAEGDDSGTSIDAGETSASYRVQVTYDAALG